MNSAKPTWRKSSDSYSNGNCVEVASLHDGQVGVRDSKAPDGPVLTVSRSDWAAFIAAVRNGEFPPAS